MAQKVIVKATVAQPVQKVWDLYTKPEHITKWNFAADDWHCPTAVNDMKVGGTYKARMEAKDGSFGFDFEAIYDEIIPQKSFTYSFGGRTSTVDFVPNGDKTDVTVAFDPEDQNPVEFQQQGWQMILNNFKKYAESK